VTENVGKGTFSGWDEGCEVLTISFKKEGFLDALANPQVFWVFLASSLDVR